jgi:hypothetical protein
MRAFLLIFMVLLFLGCGNRSAPYPKSHALLQLSSEYLKSLNFGDRELLLRRMDTHWYYIRPDGKAMLVIKDEEGDPDTFHEGLARTRIDGKIGFFDKNLDLILPAVYDFAFPFHQGVAEICVGCREVTEGGYTLLSGGKWKRINRQGLLVEE